MRLVADRLMGGLARLLIRVFFRQVHTEHPEGIDRKSPTVLVANHRNGLVDGLLLMATLSRFPRFLGKSTLFRIPILWPFLKLAGVVRVYRAQDGATDRNREAFVRSNRMLAEGGLLAIFPEGISHDEPGLQPLRTGAARIALSAADTVPGVQVVPVALVYDEKQRFRSRALVKVGVPAGVERWLPAYHADPPAAVRALTDDLAARMRAVLPDQRSWEEAQMLAEAADIVARGADDVPGEVALEDREAVLSMLTDRLGRGMDETDLAALRGAVDEYRYKLALVGLDDAQVAAGYRSGTLRRRFAAALAKVAIALPAAAVGIAVHLLPFLVVKALSRIPSNEGMRATVKLVGCFTLFIVVYIALGLAVAAAFGPWAGLVAVIATPPCGYAAVLVIERVRRIGGTVEGYRAVRSWGPALDPLLQARAAVIEATTAAMELPTAPGGLLSDGARWAASRRRPVGCFPTAPGGLLPDGPVLDAGIAACHHGRVMSVHIASELLLT